MSLGEKLRQARLEAGLSQKALCGDTITRNMLSQIENGSARPSMDTLRVLAGRLKRPLSYFLEDAPLPAPTPPLWEGIQLLEQTRKLLEAGRSADALHTLALAEEKLTDCPDWVLRQKLLLLGKFHPEQAPLLAAELPVLDTELLLRAQAALAEKDAGRACALLNACQYTDSSWQLLMGEALLLEKDFSGAALHFQAAQEQFPHRSCQALEECYRELEDYQKAYYYACRVRSLSK